MDEQQQRQERIDSACLERDLAAYAAAGCLRSLHEMGCLPTWSAAPEVLARFAAATAAVQAASGVRQEPADVPA